MVDYHNPVTIDHEFVAVVKLLHVVNGIFIWEFFTTLEYEWDVIRGRRPYRWTIWIYSLTRVSTLMAVILDMVGFDTTTRINCQVWVTFQLLFSHTAFAANTLLIVLRIIAIWNRKKVIIAIAMGLWATDLSVFIYSIIRLRSTWSPEANTCVLLNEETNKVLLTGALIVDVALLFIMLIGLFYSGLVTGPVSGIGRVLWKQGIIWLLIAMVAEVPAAVFIFLNLNVPMNLMFQLPGLIGMTIAATRIYHSLVEYASSDIRYSSHDAPGGNGRPVSDLRFGSGPVPPSRTEASVRTEHHQHPTTQTSPISSTTTGLHGDYQMHEVSLIADVECGLEK